MPIVGTLMKHALSGDTVRARSYAQLLCDDMDKQVPGSAKYLRRVLSGDLGPTVHPASPPVQAKQPAVPAGWRLVPVEPTREMMVALCEVKNQTRTGLRWVARDSDLREAWTAMLAVAPQHGGA